MSQAIIQIRGAREHNLRDVSLDLPRGRLICFTGVSGSGKSSMAFDTLFAEGQRRYIESLSSYARQFLAQLPKPQVDRIDGLSPSIAIQQKTGGRNPRSTVGTITEIADYLRVLFARVGTGHCPNCLRKLQALSRDQIVARALELPPHSQLLILAPLIREQKGEYKDLFADLARAGFVRVRVDGQVLPLADSLALERHIKHTIDLVVDRVKITPSARDRIAEAVESALKRSDGTVILATDSQDDIVLSSRYACTHCRIGFDAPTPQLFSFNSPQGACPDCQGLGLRFTIDEHHLVPDPSLSVLAGALKLLGPFKQWPKNRRQLFNGIAATIEGQPGGPPQGTLLKSPWNKLDPRWKSLWLEGSGNTPIIVRRGSRRFSWPNVEKWQGFIPELIEKFTASLAGPWRATLEPIVRTGSCHACAGSRLNPRARAMRVAGLSLPELGNLPIGQVKAIFDALASPATNLKSHPKPHPSFQPLDPLSHRIAEELLKELRARLTFLTDVGLEYLSLDRAAPTLSGGEAQRIRLASQVGAGLVGVLYVLDEPSIGLHPRDNDRLLATLQRLRDSGNTVLVVEHDEDTMRAADTIVDFGPGPGVQGGEIVASGSIHQIAKAKNSLTAAYLAGRAQIPVPSHRRPVEPLTPRLTIRGARHNNLKNLDVEFPLGRFLCVTGVSGSGKSSLVDDVLRLALEQALHDAKTPPGEHDRIDGIDLIDKIIDIDQSPIGRTPRSNPATYIKLFDLIRELYARLPDSKARGYPPGRFSFNVPGGRCDACDGNGAKCLEMDFLADVWVTCPNCEGKRFNRETLHVRFKGKSIADVLEMDVQDALAHFEAIPKIAAMLRTLEKVGLDYMKLGQPSPTLSGGEAQRIKLARELVRPPTGRTLYVLDEPTTGLHFDDVRKLLEVLHGLVDAGNTVVVIEHNLDVVKTADWVIDLGPEGGSAGGRIVAQGTPESIIAATQSHTGRALKRHLETSGKIPSANRRRSRTPHPLPQPQLRAVQIRGAAQNNLKHVDVHIPHHAMTVCSGPSGSGKTSLAIDTLYAEGQRRYVESLSSYARQFLAPLQKPKVEHIQGLLPAISIEQKTTSKSPRSTVGTATEIHDYLRVLFARLGHPFCPACNTPIGTQTLDEIVARLLHHPDGTRVVVMAPVQRLEGDSFDALWNELRTSGFVRVRIDGSTTSLDPPPKLSERRKHKIEVMVDRLVIRAAQRNRLADSVAAALDLGQGVVHVAIVDDNTPEHRWTIDRFSQHRACDSCGRSFEELSPHHFSFNSPLGWCPACDGLGIQTGVPPHLLIPNPALSLAQGALAPLPHPDHAPLLLLMLQAAASSLGLDPHTPFQDLPLHLRRLLLHGSTERWIDVPPHPTLAPLGFAFQLKGLISALDEAKRTSFVHRAKLQGLVSEVECNACLGSRLRDDSAAVRFHHVTLDQICRWPLDQSLAFFQNLNLSGDEARIAGDLLREIRERLRFLVDVGLDYLTLARGTPTLSGGEAQRIRLASQLGSGLTGVLYVLDEPTIGLHPRDNNRLLNALKRLRDLGNTLVVVEHDREVIDAADHLVDFGPGSGSAGGRVTAAGPPDQLRNNPQSLTGQYLARKKAIPIPANRRAPTHRWIEVQGARHHNLKSISARFPVGRFTVVTGVSGSGKSSLVEDILLNAAARKLHRAAVTPGLHDQLLGLNHVDKVISVDQAPIGNTPASSPATYSGLFDLVRALFARVPDARSRGFSPGRFSFNVPGGRCEACQGAGRKRIEMHFLPDVWVECEICAGKRFTADTLAVLYRGKSIADVLDMTVDQALDLFAPIPKIRRILQTLADVGLGYLVLGQPATTLSGGESQRVKLAAELARPDTGSTLYILDEPTTGLHADDIRKLLEVLHRLVDLGNTLIVVEHQLDVIAAADWILDLGPEAGELGGSLVVAGTPETVAKHPASHTGKALATLLKSATTTTRKPFDPHAALDAQLALERAARQAARQEQVTASPNSAPWEHNGRAWHLELRTTRTGKPIRWDPQILATIIQQLETTQLFPPTDWSNRSTVRIPAPDHDSPILSALTSNEWVLTLTFRARLRYHQDQLAELLMLPPWHDAIPSDAHRLDVGPARSSGQLITLRLHHLADIQTPGFQTFLDAIIQSWRKVTAKPPPKKSKR